MRRVGVRSLWSYSILHRRVRVQHGGLVANDDHGDRADPAAEGVGQLAQPAWQMLQQREEALEVGLARLEQHRLDLGLQRRHVQLEQRVAAHAQQLGRRARMQQLVRERALELEDLLDLAQVVRDRVRAHVVVGVVDVELARVLQHRLLEHLPIEPQRVRLLAVGSEPHYAP